ncbi:hypothetical protein LCGC14_2853050 [marine sediment metagenome]|uniref:Uncharacterized protein n=1 Tax=marine sediment metagenome TaxID=412755 RepID=A0A0F9AYT2_9ZZZZ
MNESIKSRFFTLRRIRHLNFWLLSSWLILRLIDLFFSYIYIVVLKAASELNPIGFNYVIVIVAFTPIFGLFIFNYKIKEMKEATFLIFFMALFLTIIQVVATINALTGGMIFYKS